MKNLLLIIAAISLFAACSPTETELVEPEKTEKPEKDTTTTKPSESNNFDNNKYWLLYKEGKFELYNNETKATGQFTVDEAERLLRMPATVWQIPVGAPYIFSSVNGLVFDKRLIK